MFIKMLLATIFLILIFEKLNALTIKNPSTTLEEKPIDINLHENIKNLPPLMFPNDTRSYKIVLPSNQTALRILQHNSLKAQNKTESVPPTIRSTTSIQSENPKDQVEDVQRITNKLQRDDILEEQFMLKKSPSTIDFIDNTEVDHPQLKHSDLAVIGAVSLAILCMFGYIGLVLWRKSLEERYGMRERLVTVDDFMTQ